MLAVRVSIYIYIFVCVCVHLSHWVGVGGRGSAVSPVFRVKGCAAPCVNYTCTVVFGYGSSTTLLNPLVPPTHPVLEYFVPVSADKSAVFYSSIQQSRPAQSIMLSPPHPLLSLSWPTLFQFGWLYYAFILSLTPLIKFINSFVHEDILNKIHYSYE